MNKHAIKDIRITAKNQKTGTLLRDHMRVEKNHAPDGPSAVWSVDLVDLTDELMVLILPEAFCFLGQTVILNIFAQMGSVVTRFESAFKVTAQTMEKQGRMRTELEYLIHVKKERVPSIKDFVELLENQQSQVIDLFNLLKGET